MRPRQRARVVGLLVAGAFAPLVRAQDPSSPPKPPDEVTRRLQQLEQEIRELKQGQQPGAKAQKQDETKERLDEQDKKLEDIGNRLDELKPGTEKFNISGFVFAGFTQPRHGISSFDSAFKPVFTYKLSDDLLVAASAEFEIDAANNTTEVNIEYCNINWMANDWLMLRGGVMLSPISTFQQNLHPQWINKMPDNPLFAADGGLAPEKALGFEARGGVRSGDSRFTYSAFVTNGPSMVTDQAAPDYGQLVLDEFADANNNKAVGGRIGYQPVSELELAYAAEYGDVQPPGSTPEHLDLWLHDFSVSYVAEPEALSGRIDARVEFMLADFNKDIPLGAASFSNDRSGGYAQLAYRPTKVESIKNFEGVIRYDRLDQPSGAPLPADEYRWTLGLNYWPMPRMVLKVAYAFDSVSDPSGALRSNDTFMLQAAVGF